MRFDLYVHIQPSAEAAEFMTKVLGMLTTIKKDTHDMTEAQDRFARELGEMKEAVTAAATKIGELAEVIRNNPNNDAVLNDAADQMDAMEAQLAAAGTPSTPPAEPA